MVDADQLVAEKVAALKKEYSAFLHSRVSQDRRSGVTVSHTVFDEWAFEQLARMQILIERLVDSRPL